MKIVETIGMGLSRVFRKTPRESGLVRMFEVEYNKEYRNLRKHGVEVNNDFVRSYLNVR